MSIIDTAKDTAQGLMQGAMSRLVPLAPDSWIPGGVPDPLIRQQHGLIGTSVSRLDGSLKVRGAAPFAAEFPIEGMVYAALTYSTIVRGRIADIDTQAAETAPGVVLVMTHRNAPRMNTPAVFGSSPSAAGPADLPIMQDDRIHWNGQPVAVVLAGTQEQADHAKSLITVTYAEEPSLVSFSAAIAAGTTPAVFMGQPLKNENGDAAAMPRRCWPQRRTRSTITIQHHVTTIIQSNRTPRRSSGSATNWSFTIPPRWSMPRPGPLQACST